MLHELRFYEIAAGKLDDYINHAGKVAVPFRGDDYGKLLGFWACEIGAVNCVFNLWEHESVATREVLRAKLQIQDVWRNDYLPHSQPLMRRQISRLLTPLADPKLPAKNINELIAMARAKPGAYNFGTVNVGSTQHLAAELFRAQAGIDGDRRLTRSLTKRRGRHVTIVVRHRRNPHGCRTG